MGRVSVTLLSGPAASGKSHACLQALLAHAQSSELATAWAILPDRAQVVAFRRQLAAARGALGIRVETLPALVEDVLIRAGQQRPRAGLPVQLKLVSSALLALRQTDQLIHFGAIAGTPGLSHMLAERISELRWAGVSPEGLLQAAGPQPGLVDLAAVYRQYVDQLQAIDWDDDAGLTARAAKVLRSQPEFALALGLLVVDGFAAFKPVELDLLQAMDLDGLEMILTLPGSAEPPGRALQRFATTQRELARRFPKLTTKILGPVRLPAPLVALQSAFERPLVGVEPGESISLLAARSPLEEVQEALRWLKARHVRHRVPLDQMALLMTESDRYLPLVVEVANEFGLPLRLQAGLSMAQSPPIVVVTDLLALVRRDWPRGLTLDLLRSPYLDVESLGLEGTRIAQLEAASYAGQVVAGIEQWRHALTSLGQRPSPKEEPTADEPGSTGLPSPAAATELLRAMEQLAHRLKVRPTQPLSAWVAWLEDVLDSFDFFERAAGQHDRDAMLRLREVLRTLVLAEQVAGPAEWTFEAFARDLTATLERTRYRPRIDWRAGNLMVVGLPDSAGLRFEDVALIGLSEGQLPAIERPDPVINETLRSALGLTPRLGRGQAGDFYLAVTRSDRHLLLTRPTLAKDGEVWEPSPYWAEVRQLIGLSESEVPLVRRGDPRPLVEAASVQEVAFLAVRRGKLPKSLEALAPRLEPLRRARQVIEARSADSASSVFEGDLSAAHKLLSDWFGPTAIWSPTRLESYGTCPHLFFSGALLGLDQVEPPTLGPDPRQLGSLLHALLERAYQAAGAPDDPESVNQALQRIAPDAFDRAPAAYGFRPSPLWDQEKAEWLTALRETVIALAEIEAGWSPFAYEQSFGRAGQPALEIETDQGTIRIAGIIDRLDRKGDQVRVIDYKTGGSHLSSGDLLAGRRLQLPAYALAAERTLGLGTVTDGLYWVIRQGKAGGLRLARFKGDEDQREVGPKAAYQQLEQHVSRIVQGVRHGSFEPEAPAGGCPPYCPAAGWCWRYQAGYQGS